MRLGSKASARFSWCFVEDSVLQVLGRWLLIGMAYVGAKLQHVAVYGGKKTYWSYSHSS